MTATTTDTSVNKLVINTLTKAQYEAAEQAGTISDTELYMISDATTGTKVTFRKWEENND